MSIKTYYVITEKFGIQGPESYLYTNGSGCLDVQGIDDVEDFSETLVIELNVSLWSSSSRNLTISNVEFNEYYWPLARRTGRYICNVGYNIVAWQRTIYRRRGSKLGRR